ncbi:hypothetical protein PoB_003260700 [Plakobranchus ocellatus]|uniref:Uncharacterized protein n=1 Tax=Plakobranchus ocellatus TaxID=259542 RepID=A0AAV4AGS3_9GAST|nr:hypothetical protein PoB_003260700 [Plakobranchus ocellatus]
MVTPHTHHYWVLKIVERTCQKEIPSVCEVRLMVTPHPHHYCILKMVERTCQKEIPSVCKVKLMVTPHPQHYCILKIVERTCQKEIPSVCKVRLMVTSYPHRYCILIIQSTKQGALRLSGPPSGQRAGCGARTRDGKVPADLRAGLLPTVPPAPSSPF